MLAEDLLHPPGVFSNYSKFQAIERSLNRVGIFLERMPFDGRAYLYRLPPSVVEEMTYGGKK